MPDGNWSVNFFVYFLHNFALSAGDLLSGIPCKILCYQSYWLVAVGNVARVSPQG